MMKIIKKFMVLLVFFGITQIASAQLVKIGGNVNYYAISDSLYKDFYGSGNIMVGASLSLLLLKWLELRGELNYYKDKGNLSITDEEITFTITPLVIGFRFLIIRKPHFIPYLGIGYDRYSYSEDYPDRFEDYSDTASGFHVEGGTYYKLSRRFILDFNLRYTKADTQPFDEKIALGGIRAGIGIEFGF